ncbi:alpha-crystallin domain-containing protein 22.3-like [Hibiscus syriacus]|uniref:alpha-crystallin domain-containing protein 22.3-like n=1 Tax=Hibiscus syriacus TaxID=106335 RepID=UPI0019241228|nr:alpha-crystallin domain-containing protein 22.3-like [Hibiscus syriacus]
MSDIGVSMPESERHRLKPFEKHAYESSDRSKRKNAGNYEQKVGPTNPDEKFISPGEKSNVAETIGPAMIFLPAGTSQEELDAALASTKYGVALTGAAATGALGPIVGLVDLREWEDSYYFRVTLPGVSQDKQDFSCDIDADGKVLIKGISTTGEKVVQRGSLTFTMVTQNLCPPGEFTVSFELPSPVNTEEVTSHLADGMLEVMVKKR